MLRLKVFHRDFSDWQYQVIDGRGDVLAERKCFPDRLSAERVGEHERRRLAAGQARAAAAQRQAPPPVLKQHTPAHRKVRVHSWTALLGRTR